MKLVLPDGFDPVERGERAEQYFNEGYNCCQAVVLAFSDVLSDAYGLDADTIATMTTGFGGGFGRMREVCGAVSGMTMMAVFIQPAADISDKSAKSANYALVQEFAAAYKAENGSIICRELLGLAAGAPTPHVPADRTPEYYKKRPCGKLVNLSATIVARKLSENE